MEGEGIRFLRQPAERSRLPAPRLQLRSAVHGYIHGATGVVLAIARRGAYLEDFFQRQAARQLSANDLRLPVKASESGDDANFQAIGPRCRAHGAPGVGGGRNEEVLAPIGPELGDHQDLGFLAQRKCAAGEKIRRNLQ